MEVVVNKCYGGFSLSHKAVMLYAEKKGITLYPMFQNYTSGISLLSHYTYWDGQGREPFISI